MEIGTLTWAHVLGAAALYWAILIPAWLFHTTRPSTQARARERAVTRTEIDPATGEMLMTLQHPINVGRVAAILLGPPLLLVAAWLVARAA